MSPGGGGISTALRSAVEKAGRGYSSVRYVSWRDGGSTALRSAGEKAGEVLWLCEIRLLAEGGSAPPYALWGNTAGRGYGSVGRAEGGRERGDLWGRRLVGTPLRQVVKEKGGGYG